VFVAVAVVIYALIGATPASRLLVVLVGVQALFVLNRWFRRQAVAAMRDATLEEIEEIHQRHADALEERVRAAHEYLELPYGYNAALP
jgi:predicted Zn-dependent peptidase